MARSGQSNSAGSNPGGGVDTIYGLSLWLVLVRALAQKVFSEYSYNPHGQILIHSQLQNGLSDWRS